MPIRSTVPICPFASIESPIRKGLSIRSMIPPAKLDRDPCKAKPIATPAAAKAPKKEETGTPTFWITVRKRMI